jgi:hypothetical protein
VSAPATYVLGDLEKMKFEIRSVRLPEPASDKQTDPKIMRA